MHTLGLIGGMSWESTIPYYRAINTRIKKRLGGLHSAKLLLYSVDFAEIEQLQHMGDWDKAERLLGDVAQRLQQAGASALVICTNTMHCVVPEIEKYIQIPVLHIADATAICIAAQGIDCVGLLGTRFTMEQDFFRSRLEQHGLRVILPNAEQRSVIHRVIYEELCLGQYHEESRNAYREIMHDLVIAGARGIILGCTEIGLLVRADDSEVPQFDTTTIHAEFAADWSLA